MTRRALLLLSFFFVACQMQASTNTGTPELAPGQANQSIVLGGGCFWCLDAAFRLVPGVVSVECGYAGGTKDNPTYKAVCSGSTGHAEVVRIVFDGSKLTLGRLLDLFWHIHDPTTLNRQGNDVGTQYRSVIFCVTPEQRKLVEESLMVATKDFDAPIVTEVSALAHFWPAEDYHQDYFAKNPGQGYCQMVVRSKVEKMKRVLKDAP